MPGLTSERLREVLDYEPETGLFRWKHAKRGWQHTVIVAGSVAGHPYGLRGLYWGIYVDGRHYMAHRLAWLYVYDEWPSEDIDHRDRNGQNNRIDNLREATRTQNNGNCTARKTNKSGFKGVSRYARSQRRPWVAFIQIDRKNQYLGCYATPEEAHAAYMNAANEHFGEFAGDQ
jgi:hypothetical protein